MLTMLPGKKVAHDAEIVEVVQDHLAKVNSDERNQKINIINLNNEPRRQPANNAFEFAAVNRPIRDPRLLRQQHSLLQQKRTENSPINTAHVKDKNNLDLSNKIINRTTETENRFLSNAKSDKKRTSYPPSIINSSDNLKRMKIELKPQKTNSDVVSAKLDNPKKSIFPETGRMKRRKDENLHLNNAFSAKNNTNEICEDNFPKRFARENRRGMPYWKGDRGRKHRDAPPLMRPQQRPWMQLPMQLSPINNWAPPRDFSRQLPENVLNNNNDYKEEMSPDSTNTIFVKSARQEDIKTITIDGLPRYIRYYDEVAVIFMDWDDPREISFHDGTRRVSFNDTDMYLLNFNKPDRECRIREKLYHVRLGGPSREIYINYKPYECYFGGPGITIDLDGKFTTIKLDGPPPQVKIGNSRKDLVAGKIILLIDSETTIPIFLDSKVQSFTFNGEKHTIKLCKGLKGVLIDEKYFDVQFGGLSTSVVFKNKRHDIRFSVLPKGLKPGQIQIMGLESDDVSSSSRIENNPDIYEPVLPAPQNILKMYDPIMSSYNSNSTSLSQNIVRQEINNRDSSTNVVSSSEIVGNTSSHQVKNQLSMKQPDNIPSSRSSFNLKDIDDLFQKLVASGLITTQSSLPIIESLSVPIQNKESSRHNNEQSNQPIELVSFSNPEQLKIREAALYEKLYSGMQCSNCGMRFPPEQSMCYREHLDWHFRQNRRQKKNSRVACNRKWYYSLDDWKKYEAIEDLDERDPNFFDLQKQAKVSSRTVQLPSVKAYPELRENSNCEVCGDELQIFFNDNEEEWQFNNSIRFEDKLYHPICFEEYQKSFQHAANEDSNTRHEENIGWDKIPGIESTSDDDEDMKNTEEVVVEVILHGIDESDEKSKTEEFIYEDDDVMIIEETIEQIILGDDDDKPDEDQLHLDIEAFTPPESAKTKEVAEIIDDGFVDVNEGLLMLKNGGPLKVKSEPIDEDVFPEDTIFETMAAEKADTSVDMQDEPREMEQTPSSFVPSIDGNFEIVGDAPTPATSVSKKIKINIHKPIPKNTRRGVIKDMFIDSDTLHEAVIDPSQPLPPIEEPILLKLKPALQGVQLKKMPTVQNGSELTGLCAIM